MKKLLIVMLAVLPEFAVAAEARDPRVGMSSMVNSRLAPGQNRAMVASKNQLTTPDNSLSTHSSMSPSIKDDKVHATLPIVSNDDKDNRDAERAACLNNNIGVGNTFVWASRYSNTSDYALMTEDVDNPQNNTCFVRVDLRSADSRIDVSDIPSHYFPWGEMITCGSWVDEAILTKRILDAKKKGRTWATVGGAVGGAAIGAGSMELFGNELIGGKLEGQKSLNQDELLRSQLLVLKNNGDSRFGQFMTHLEELKALCDGIKNDVSKLPSQCTTFKYDELLKLKA